ncbi:MAG: hypothetical protein E5W43_08200 [Mesorhizobium sp.]|nr:MAG: hypothetical protein E5W43_08200 [Mesorhizobium sp.]
MEPSPGSGSTARGDLRAESKKEHDERIQAMKVFECGSHARTGMLEAQARELIDLIGNDSSSPLREARLLAREIHAGQPGAVPSR